MMMMMMMMMMNKKLTDTWNDPVISQWCSPQDGGAENAGVENEGV